MSDKKTKQTEMELHQANAEAQKALLRPKKTIQIAVGGGVLITAAEQEIIDTEDFQRLRWIRQLGLAYYVYPTALHTRFDHSLGTLEMASQMVEAICQNAHSRPEERDISYEQIAMVRIYALLHDITHIPFGHSIEDELDLLVRHDKNDARIQRFLGPGSEIGKIIVRRFGEPFRKTLLDIYTWDGKPGTFKAAPDLAFVHDLVSNTVCADLLDYLRRDNFFCNLGISLEYHFLKYLYLRRDEQGYLRVFVRLWKDDEGGGKPRRDILSDLCRLLEARYLLAERVYFHHAKIVAGAMLGRAVQEAQAVGEITEQLMWSMTDDVLAHQLTQSESPLAKKLASELRGRKLYREEHAFSWADIEKPQSHSHLTNQYNAARARIGSPKDRRDFENRVADIIGAEPGDVLIYAPTRKMNRKEAEMNVLWKGKMVPFKDIDDVMVRPRLTATLDAHELLWSIRLLVRRSLTSAQRHLARQLCELELMSSSEDREETQRTLFTSIVENSLAANDQKIPQSAAEFRKQVTSTVETLMGTAQKSGEPFSSALRKEIQRNFPQ
jgi:HD superfamily phosphohydrolase